jgi:uncharacterized protein YciI
MRYVAILTPGPNWTPGGSIRDQNPRILGEHLRYMRGRYDEGSLLFGGPYADEPAGIALLETPSREQASAIMESDPAIRTGLMVFRLSDVRPFFDAFSGKAWSPRI